jgi:hypothetical protein
MNTQVQDHPTYPSATPAVQVAEGLSPYEAAKVVNKWLADEGHDKKIPQQMLYNYTTARISKGKAPLIKATGTVGEDGKVHAKIKLEDLTEWYARYTAKNLPAL